MTDTTAANESMLEIAVDAAATGHDLTGFEPVDAAVGLPDDYQARCRKCDRTAWVGECIAYLGKKGVIIND